MWSFNMMIDALLDLVLRPFHLGPPLVPLSLFAVLSGLVMLMIFRYTSNQLAMKQAKNHIKAHLLELRLFKDDLAVIMTAQKQILLSNLVYLKHVSKRQRRERHSRLFLYHTGEGHCVQSFDGCCRGVKMYIDTVWSCG